MGLATHYDCGDYRHLRNRLQKHVWVIRYIKSSRHLSSGKVGQLMGQIKLVNVGIGTKRKKLNTG